MTKLLHFKVFGKNQEKKNILPPKDSGQPAKPVDLFLWILVLLACICSSGVCIAARRASFVVARSDMEDGGVVDCGAGCLSEIGALKSCLDAMKALDDNGDEGKGGHVVSL